MATWEGDPMMTLEVSGEEEKSRILCIVIKSNVTQSIFFIMLFATKKLAAHNELKVYAGYAFISYKKPLSHKRRSE